ncbi:MAG: helix-turn-helix transcriptional regulator [Spirochaetales bacterium]|nr:helix-turn-helix transcriptional regulator [Spirochaetales bacterium]
MLIRGKENEDRVYPLENSTPGRMVAFFMEQHGHKQKDLSDIAPQSVISEIINGRRVPTTEQVKKLSLKYHTNPAEFL